MKTSSMILASLAIVTAVNAADINLGACVGCHGADWSKAALGKSKIVKDMSKEDIVTALKGYKAGTYNSAGMGGIMKGQVMTYTDKQIAQIASQIAKK